MVSRGVGEFVKEMNSKITLRERRFWGNYLEDE
jgi:hypothetical protein